MKERKAGVLLHIASLPSKYGIGTLGIEAYKFVDFLASAKMKLWQILPLGITSYGDSPYSAISSKGLNYYFIDFDILKSKNLLKKEEYNFIKVEDLRRIDYKILFDNKLKILKIAFNRFDKDNKAFLEFVDNKEFHEVSMFLTLREKNNYEIWNKWPDFEKNYSPKLEKMILNEYKDLYLFYQWTQFEFINEWNKLKQYAHKNDISIIGDIPIYLAYDSSDVWYNPDLFLLDKNKEMIYISACVPDGFNPDGQLWCNPIYDYNYMKKDNYAWWRKRLFNSLALYDILRIDHFRGFDRFYMVENGSINAKDGSWKDGPKEELFKDILDKNIIVEDLCVMDDGVRRLLKNVKYPGMRILEEAFDGNKNNIHKPSNNNANYVLYTETHDGIPVMGLLNTLSEERKEIFVNDLIEERNKLSLKTKKLKKDKDIIDSMIELAYKSSAKYVIIPVQDLLYQDENYRMNLPGVIGKNNWSYRILPNELKSKAAKKLRKYGEKYQR